MPEDYTIEIVHDKRRLDRLVDRLGDAACLTLDLETVNWWNRRQERIALIQLAFREAGKLKAVIVDALAPLDLEPLRLPLENPALVKVIHNAAFDATRLAAHLKFRVAPVFDTMLAARRGGDKQYSLAAQAELHLGLRLDKAGQRADWSRRPLGAKLIAYAALDAVAALLLSEQQRKRGLNGAFELKTKLVKQPPSPRLPFRSAAAERLTVGSSREQSSPIAAAPPPQNQTFAPPAMNQAEVELPVLALLGVISELPSRYYPEQLAASVGASERTGLTGWILDRMLGTDTDVDEAAVKLAISELCAQELVRVTATRRLIATGAGDKLWQRAKPN